MRKGRRFVAGKGHIMRSIIFGAALAVLGVATAASASGNLVTNGSFETSSATIQPGYSGVEFGVDVFNTGFISQSVTGWSATLPGGISFYFDSTKGPSTNPVQNRYNDPRAYLAATYPGPSPDGGNFVGFDSDQVGDGAGKYNSPFEQALTGLTVGGTYKLVYYWAGSQLQNRNGPTTAQMTATFGGVTQTTGAPILVPSQGFVGWSKVTNYFTATSANDTLSFLAFGTPAGAPPFALLDGVSLTAVPEPASWALIIAGFGLVGVAARQRRRSVAA